MTVNCNFDSLYQQNTAGCTAEQELTLHFTGVKSFESFERKVALKVSLWPWLHNPSKF